jgi:regulator of RNase E activity RraA
MTVSDETITLLQALNTPTLANALEDLGIVGVIEGLPPAGPGLRCVGRAVTVLEMTGPRGAFPASDFKVGEMIDAAGKGDVVVVSNGGAPISTWGGTASYAAHLKGIAGLVVDGGIRDREEICQIGFPAFARHMIPTTGKTRYLQRHQGQSGRYYHRRRHRDCLHSGRGGCRGGEAGHRLRRRRRTGDA